MKKCGYSYNLMLKKTPYHIISEQKNTRIPAAHPYTDTYEVTSLEGLEPSALKIHDLRFIGGLGLF